MNVKYRSLLLLQVVAFWGLISCSESRPTPPGNQITVTPPSPAASQENAGISLDKSPMDMSYFPVDYPKQKMLKADTEALVARVIYSRPRKDKRVIFGDVVKYGSPWRLGANEATEIEFFTNVSIGSQRIEKGRYVLYCIPQPDKWKIILSKDLYTWGLKFDPSKDVYNFEVPVKKLDASFERFTMEFERAEKGMELHIAWDTLYASVPIMYQER